MTNSEKVLENRLRRVAARRGLTISKNRVRDPKAIGYGRYKVYGEFSRRVLTDTTLQEMAKYFDATDQT